MSLPEVNTKYLDDIARMYDENPDTFPRIAVFVITYKAGKLLTETLERIPEKLIPALAEIFIVDDFSEDGTYEIGRSTHPQSSYSSKLKVYKNPRNYGYGGNQKIGYRYAIERSFDYVVLLHGDAQYAPEYLPNMIWPVLFEDKKVVFGSRMMKQGEALKGGMPKYKYVGNKILTTVSNAALGMNLSEFHSGYRLYASEVLRKIPFEDNTDDFHFDTQIIIQCMDLGVDIHETPIPTYYGDEICRVNGMKYAFDVLKENFYYLLQRLHIIRLNRYVILKNEQYRIKNNRFSSHKQIVNMVPEGSNVLDVGCGPGFFAKLLQEKSVQVTGIDMLEHHETFTEMRDYYQVDLNDFDKLPVTDKFDVVIAADVVEHLVNGSELLATAKKFVKTDGRMIASTGNISIWFYRLSLLLGRFQYGDKGILDKTHVRLYTPSTWYHTIRAAGFRIIRKRYTPIPFEEVFPKRLNFLSEIVTFIYQGFVRIWPAMFAYQVIVEAELEAVDFGSKENIMDPEMYRVIEEGNRGR